MHPLVSFCRFVLPVNCSVQPITIAHFVVAPLQPLNFLFFTRSVSMTKTKVAYWAA